MIQLAINYSPAAAQLLQAGRLPIQRFKCPDWPDLVAEASALLPVAVHFSLSAGSGQLAQTDWERVEQLRQVTGTPYVNLHLDALQQDFPGMPRDTHEPAHIRLVTERLLHDVNAAVERFGAGQVIVENVPYQPDGSRNDPPYDKCLRPAVLPEVIRQVVQESGCGLLLDIPHARISAHNLGLDEREYLTSLPVESIRELHVTGLHTNQFGFLQDHLSMLESDWPSLEWVLERIRGGEWGSPWLLAFEYGGVGWKFEQRSDPQVIESQVPELRRRLVGDI